MSSISDAVIILTAIFFCVLIMLLVIGGPINWARERTFPLDVYRSHDVMIDEFLPETLRQMAEPTGGDQMLSDLAFQLFTAMGDEYLHHTLGWLIDEVHQCRPMGASHMFGLLRIGLAKQLLRDAHLAFPEFFDTSRPYGSSKMWRSALRLIIGGVENGRLIELARDMCTRQPATNEPQRQAGPALMAQLLGSPTLEVDVGCSQNLGSRWRVLGMSFGHVDAIGADGEPDDRITAAVNRLLHLRSPGLKVGVDVNDMFDPDAINWFSACAYPRELLDKERRLTLRALSRFVLSDDLIRFYCLDFSTDEGISALRQHLGIQKDGKNTGAYPDRWATLVTSAYQNPSLVDRALGFAGPEGIVLVQDHVAVDPEDASKLIFSDHWGRWGYRTFVMQMAHQERGWQLIAEAETSRWKRISLGSGSLVVEGNVYTLPELIEMRDS